MKVTSNREYAICSTDVRGINNKEMSQMHELKTKIKAILDSHKEGAEKKQYVSDEDLCKMYAILHVFTKEYSATQTSAFDDALGELKKEKESANATKADEE